MENNNFYLVVTDEDTQSTAPFNCSSPKKYRNVVQEQCIRAITITSLNAEIATKISRFSRRCRNKT